MNLTIAPAAGPISHDRLMLAPMPPNQAGTDVDGPSGSRVRCTIEGTVGHVFGVSCQDLERPSRGRARVAFARQVGMYVGHVVCGLSLTDVGHIFERDRTTVAHACSVVEDRRDDPGFDHLLDLVECIVKVLLAPRTDGQSMTC